MLSLRYIAPCEALTAYVRSYYCVDGASPGGSVLSDRLMPGAATLRFERSGSWRYGLGATADTAFPAAAFVGATSSTVAVATSEHFSLFGADLTPLGQALLLGGSVNDLADRCAPLGDILEPDWYDLQAMIAEAHDDTAAVAIADSFLTRKFAAREEAHALRPEGIALIRHMVAGAGAGLTVAGLAQTLGRSERQVERLSRAYLGFAPNVALRRLRFLQAVRAIVARPDASWIDVAGEGYYDQSHFVREFKAFCAMTPGQFARRQGRFMDIAEPIDQEGARLAGGYRLAPEQTPAIRKPNRPRRWSCYTRSTMEFIAAA